MKTTLRRISKGIRYIPGYGSHPGNVPLFFLVLLGAVAGYKDTKSTAAAFTGAAVMLLVFGALYLCGAYARGKDSE